MRFLQAELFLVFPPVTNQEATWLSREKDVQEQVKHSKLYMIGQREELLFCEFSYAEETHIFHFRFKMGNVVSPPLIFNLGAELKKQAVEFDDLGIDIGERIFRVMNPSTKECVMWFTPTALLYYISHDNLTVRTENENEFDYGQFSTYELLYVGISKEHSSLVRLFQNAHHARVDILSNIHPKSPGSRVTDELMIFLFDIDFTNINVFNTSDDVDNDLHHMSDKLKIIADSEKAFVKLLDTEYNSVKFEQYPKGKDGLFQDQLARYGYSIREDIRFSTRQGEFDGATGHTEPRDLILIEDDVARVIKSYEL
jgi:hypothetical protein